MKEEIKKNMKRAKRFFKNPVTITIVTTIIIGIIVFIIEKKYGVNENVITLSLIALVGFTGYFLIHFLEIKRKEREERLKQYKELASKIRVFVKEMDDKSKLGEEFDEVYYTSWMTISSNVYKKIVNYLDSYNNWVSNGKKEELLIPLRKNLKELMNIMRKEFIDDEEVEFKDYDIKWNKKAD